MVGRGHMAHQLKGQKLTVDTGQFSASSGRAIPDGPATFEILSCFDADSLRSSRVKAAGKSVSRGKITTFVENRAQC